MHEQHQEQAVSYEQRNRWKRRLLILGGLGLIGIVGAGVVGPAVVDLLYPLKHSTEII